MTISTTSRDGSSDSWPPKSPRVQAPTLPRYPGEWGRGGTRTGEIMNIATVAMEREDNFSPGPALGEGGHAGDPLSSSRMISGWDMHPTFLSDTELLGAPRPFRAPPSPPFCQARHAKNEPTASFPSTSSVHGSSLPSPSSRPLPSPPPAPQRPLMHPTFLSDTELLGV